MLYMQPGPWAWVGSRANPNYSSSPLRSPNPLFARGGAKGCPGRVAAGCCWGAGTPRWHAVCTGPGPPRCHYEGLHRPGRPTQPVATHRHLRARFGVRPPRCARPNPARGQVGRLVGRFGGPQLCVFKPHYPPISPPPPNTNGPHLLLGDSGPGGCPNVTGATWPLLFAPLVGAVGYPRSSGRLWRPPKQPNCPSRLGTHAVGGQQGWPLSVLQRFGRFGVGVVWG